MVRKIFQYGRDIGDGEQVTFPTYCQKKLQDGEWCGTVEILLTAYLFDVNIVCFYSCPFQDNSSRVLNANYVLKTQLALSDCGTGTDTVYIYCHQFKSPCKIQTSRNLNAMDHFCALLPDIPISSDNRNEPFFLNMDHKASQGNVLLDESLDASKKTRKLLREDGKSAAKKKKQGVLDSWVIAKDAAQCKILQDATEIGKKIDWMERPNCRVHLKSLLNLSLNQNRSYAIYGKEPKNLLGMKERP